MTNSQLANHELAAVNFHDIPFLIVTTGSVSAPTDLAIAIAAPELPNL
ncbi:hypothetical protein [Trichocoleus sp. FACHB-262]|nr:hypothetical protein [Trichocoleus sp. FACHB-262]MBD2121941.1 hypothetical protein [Trichocoleus sp. FACHB-262]